MNPKKSNKNPRESVNAISALTWWWTIGLFKKGYTKILGLEDLYEPLKKDKSDLLGNRLQAQWEAELQKAKESKRCPSLLRAVCRTFFCEYFLVGCILGFHEIVLRIGIPLLLGFLLNYFKPNPTTTYEMALIYASGIALINALTVITKNQYYFNGLHVGGRIKIAVCNVIYKKALRLSKTALGDTAPGKVVNLVANDVNRFSMVTLTGHFLWCAPLSCLVISIILYYEAGYAGLIGIIFPAFIVCPIQIFNAKLTSIFRLRTAIKTDERIRLMDEVVSGIQIIKMYAWEKPFCALIKLARKLELKFVRRNSYIRGAFMIFALFTTRVSLYCAIVAMLLMHDVISADKIFVLFSYFNILSDVMSGMLMRSFSEIAEVMVTIRRLQTFLTYEECETKNMINDSSLTSNRKLNNLDSKDNFKGISELDLPYVDDYIHCDESPPDRPENNIMLTNCSTTNNSIQERNHYLNERNQAFSGITWTIKIDNVTAKWNMYSSEIALENINLEVARGKLYIVIGTVGSGKSSLLSTILGEISLQQGDVKVNGSISYAAQESWIFGASIRQNILFGQEYNKHKYYKVVRCCALLNDFKQFPQGDQTIVGERGSSLSGGQKARVNLARAVYRQADIYLLDDPLSAVDTHVGKHLFEECLQVYLSGKTRILATHQLQYIKDADFIILIEQGKLQKFNNYHELLNEYPEYNSLIAEKEAGDGDEELPEKPTITRRISSNASLSHTSSIGELNEEQNNDASMMANIVEETSRGFIKGSVFIKYLSVASSFFYASFMVLLLLLTQAIVSYTDLFATEFVTAEESRAFYKNLNVQEVNGSNLTVFKSSAILKEEDIHPTEYYLYIYTTIVLLIFIVGITRSFVFYDLCMHCSQNIHDLAFSKLIYTDMRFFDTNPSGRILNRFSKDLGSVDELLPRAMLDASQVILMVLGSLAVSCTVNPYLLIPICFMGALFYWLRTVYLKTSNNIVRLEGMTKSPVFTHLNTTLTGLTTIRAHKVQDIFMKEFDQFQNTNTSAWYMFIVAATAFGFTLQFCCFILTTLVMFSFILLKDNFSGGEVGLVITQIIAFSEKVQWGMRQSAEAENQLTSFERVLEYSKLPPEPNMRIEDAIKKNRNTKPSQDLLEIPKNWPNRGNIKFKNVYLRYSETDEPVLRNLNFIIQSCEKIGIVGRTGAGKSSLISAIFRLAKIEGVVEIDEINTSTIALQDLRKHISIIPQDPVLFSGSLRRNLDPFNEFSDQLLWNVLEEVELKNIASLNGNVLDSSVQDRGTNFSVGQRQLICLARAILRNNKILLLDEATANVDPHTDSLIQHTIRTKFAQCTVLTVAHRLNTIMDSDKVMVMSNGSIVEFDHPHVLLQNENGQFTSLVKETGQAMYEQLCKVARDAYLSR